jgi:uroporphyrinogen III methyltransferase/synthase
VRLKGGDPFLFGRGGEEVEALAEAGLTWEVVPGVTSAFAVPAAAGIPVTQRGVAASVTVVTGRVGESDGTSAHDWEALARVGGTLVILMGMTNRAAIAAALMQGGLAPDTAVAVIARGTTASQQMARTTLAGLAEVDLGPPAVIVVGPVAALGPYDPTAGAVVAPLAGRTVVVTRGGERAGDLVDALTWAGATALELPLTRQVDPADGGAALRAAAAGVRDNAWVALTSVTAVERFMGALRDARDLGSVLVAAVGPATADALRRAGVEADLVPAEHSARGLVEAFPDAATVGSRRVLFPAADLAPGTIPDGLARLGWDVRRVEAYRTVPRATPEPALLERVAAADAVTFTAPSAVQAFLALRSAAGSELTPPVHVVCIGATTAAAARAAGLDGVHEARDASPQGIVDALIDTLGAGPDPGP